MNEIKEGKVKIKIVLEKTVSKKMPVFYNPIMELNRTISVLILQSIENKELQIGLPLEASGIRGIRFLKELSPKKIKIIHFNDYNKEAVTAMKENLKLNKINKKIVLHCEDANLFLLNSNGFDYIDIDPFGTPNPFLDSAIKRISRQGILAITATDTAALCGTYPDACQRKYWATPNRTEIMHEIGLRILIRKCQLIGAQFDKALIPIFSYSIEHYMRIFFLCEKGKKKVDETLAKHGNFNNSGPMWLGSLWEEKIIEKMILNYKKIYENNNSTISSKEIENLLNKIKQESKINAIGFYHLPSVAKRNSLGVLPKQNAIIESIIKKGYVGSPTHFKENSIRTNISEKELSKIIKEI